MEGYNVLIIDDDPYILETFDVIIQAINNCNSFTALNFSQARDIVIEHKIHLIFVDVILPGTNGYEVCKELKNHPNCSNAYYIMMSATKKGLINRIKAFNHGVHEFMGKPIEEFKEIELMIRSKMSYYFQLTEQEANCPEDILVINSGDFRIETNTRKAFKNALELKLTGLELDFLLFLEKQQEKIVSIDEIIEHVWGGHNRSNPDNVRSLVARLRQKIESDPQNPFYLINSKGNGYIFYPGGNTQSKV